MPDPFAAAAAAAAATHDAIMGEEFDYRPMKAALDVNARLIVDPARAIVTGLRIPFGDPGARAASGPTETPGVRPDRGGHATARPFLALQLALLPYAPAQGDRILRQKTGALYAISEIVPSTPGFARLDLNMIKS